jgi:hypothetical protein
MTNPLKAVSQRKNTMEASLQKLGKRIRKNLGQATTTLGRSLGNEDLIRARKLSKPGKDESLLRVTLQRKRTGKK